MRAAQYVQRRLQRLPDTPHKIGRGIFAGVFVVFTPFYGLHVVLAALVAWLIRGNILAAILSTFFGNPLTYVPIALVSLQTGYFLMGIEPGHDLDKGLAEKFTAAGRDLWVNLRAYVVGQPRDWENLTLFWDAVFFPYLIGGIAPGIVTGVGFYYAAVPLIERYRKRRKGRLKMRMNALKQAVRRERRPRQKGVVKGNGQHNASE